MEMKALWPVILWLCLIRTVSSSTSALAEMPDCASKCLATAIASSQCDDTNHTCICSDEALQVDAAGCITWSCTFKESLVATNLTMTDCNAPVRNKSQGVVVEAITLAVISTLFIIQRFSMKTLWGNPIGFDDWFILLSYLTSLAFMLLLVCGVEPHGLGRDIWTLPAPDITAFGKYLYAMGFTYVLGLTLVKISLLFFYLRIFPTPPVRRVLWCTIIFNTICGIASCLIILLQCLPITYYWNRWDGEHQGHCVNMNATAWSFAALSIAIDIWMLVVPLSQLRSLNLDWKKKIGVGIMFSVGTFATITSILRLHSLFKFTTDIPNPTWNLTGIIMWSSIEVNVGIICACLPSLRLFLAHIFPRILGTSQRHYSDQARRDQTGLSNSRSKGLGMHIQTVADVEISRRNEPEGITCHSTYAVEFGDGDETHLVPMRDLDRQSSMSNVSL